MCEIKRFGRHPAYTLHLHRSPFETRFDWLLLQEGRKGSGGHLLVVRRGERQSRNRRFFRRGRWAPESRKLWKNVGRACEWMHPRAPLVWLLKTTPVVLAFLRGAKAGGMANLASLGAKEEGGVEDIGLRPQKGEGG